VTSGRVAALAQVRDAVAQRRQVVVLGPAGIGKTTLVEELAASHQRAFVGQSLPALTARALHPLRHALGASYDVDGDGLHQVSTEVARAVGKQGVLILEDVQWADLPTLEVITRLEGERAVVCTVQSGAPGAREALAALRVVDPKVVELEPLGDETVGAVVRSIAPDLLDGEVDRIVQAAGGNPRVAQVLVAVAERSGPVAVDKDTAVIAALLSRLPAGARCSLFMLGAARAPLPRPSLDDVDTLLEAGLVVPDDDGRFEAAHELFTRAELLGVDPATRRRAHRRLVEQAGHPPAARCEYLLEAGEPAEAMALALSAAEGPLGRAEQAEVLRTAARAARELVSQGAAAPADVEDVLINAARALNDTLRFSQAAELLDGIDLGGSAAQLAAVIEVLRSEIGRGERARAVSVLERSEVLIRDADGLDGARARTLQHWLTPWSGTPEELRRLAREQLDAGATGSDRAQASMNLGMASYPSDIEDTVRWLRVAQEEAASDGALASEFDATRNLLLVQIALGRYADARVAAEAAEQRAIEAGEASWAMEFRTMWVLSGAQEDEHQDAALSWFSHVRTAPVRMETRAIATSSMAILLVDRGAVRRSEEVLGPWLVPARLDELAPMSQVLLTAAAAHRAWILGDLAETLRWVRWVTDTVPQGFPGHAGMQVLWAWAELESGAPITAPTPYGGLLDCAEIEAEAIALLADGQHARATQRFLDAAASWSSVLLRCTARCRWAAGHSAALGGDRPRALELLEQLDAELDRSGMPALRPRVQASIRIAAPTAATTRRPRVDSLLTPQELQVMLLVVEGLTSGEIAKRLGISPSTVNTHVRAAKRKLGARTRIEAAAMVGLASA
jgi:DNA-binding CsgD family transcriptional regulator